MTVVPMPGEMIVRRIPFTFPDDLDPIWNPAQPEWSHMVTGASITMPYLEPFLIATLRQGVAELDDEVIVADAKAFIGQEAQHFRTHRRFNEVVKAAGYPALADVEDAMAASYERMTERRSLRYRLAYAAGFETMSLGMCAWLTGERRKLFAGSDTRVASFILWHFVEEEEHKRVAFGVYQAAYGDYWPRAWGVFMGAGHVFWYSRKACLAMLHTDGKRWNVRARLRLWRRTVEFFAAVIPGALRGLRPGHTPDAEPESPWARAWIEAYATTAADADGDELIVPLVDTSHPDLPVPFATPEVAA